MTGTPLDRVPGHWRDAVRSALQFPVYRLACDVLDLPRERWPDKLAAIPESIRDQVRAECRRVFDLRRSSGAE